MPSRSLQAWKTVARAALDELVAAHRSVGGSGRGRRFATQQINQAYAVLVSSQFQGFCRNLHSESADYFIQSVPTNLQTTLRTVLVQNRQLDKGNANSGNIKSDFNRFGLLFWEEVIQQDSRNQSRKNKLEDLNKWRNAIAHQDFPPPLQATPLHFGMVKKWRTACNCLAKAFDEVMRSHLSTVNGSSPW